MRIVVLIIVVVVVVMVVISFYSQGARIILMFKDNQEQCIYVRCGGCYWRNLLWSVQEGVSKHDKAGLDKLPFGKGVSLGFCYG